MKLIRSFAALSLVFAASPAAIHNHEVALTFDPAQTEVKYSLGSLLHTVHGTFRLKSGEIRFDPSTGKASGELSVDSASGASGSNARDSRMNKAILESSKYPEITFRPDHIEGNVTPEGVSKIEVHGIFRIHGADHELTMPVQVQFEDGRYAATTTFDVPFISWGMRNPSTLFLRVPDKVEISIRTVARLTAKVTE